MSKPKTDPMFSPLLECTLPVLSPKGYTDAEVIAEWEANGPRVYDPRGPRIVRLGKNSTDHVMHPHDVVNGMTRIPAYRPKRGRR